MRVLVGSGCLLWDRFLMIDKRIPDRPGSSGDEGGIRLARSARNLLARTKTAEILHKVTAEATASTPATKPCILSLADDHLSMTQHENRDAQRAHRLVQPRNGRHLSRTKVN